MNHFSQDASLSHAHVAEYIWNVGWYDLTGSLEEASKHFSNQATSNFISTLDAQVSHCLRLQIV